MRKLFFILALMALLVACGGDDDDTGLSSSSDGDSSQDSAPTEAPVPSSLGLPDPEPGVMQLPSLPEAEGGLVFTRGEGLYYAEFGGEEATLLVDGIPTTTVTVSPDGQYVYHGSPGIRGFRLIRTELATGEQMDILPLPGGRNRAVGGRIYGYSPDGEWMIIMDMMDQLRSHVVRPDGSDAYVFARNIVPVWLADSTLLQIEHTDDLTVAFQLGQTLDPAGFSQYDPATDTTTPLDVPVNDVVSFMDFNNLDATLTEADMELADPFEGSGYTLRLPDEGGRLTIIQPPENLVFQPVACNTWRIEHMAPDGTRTDIYTVDDKLWLTDLRLLPDGSVLFLEWSMSDCDLLNGTQTVKLQHWTTDGGVRTITDEVSPIEEGRGALNALVWSQGHRYAVSPDGQYVVWPSGSLATSMGTLNITQLQTGDTGVLLRSETVADANSFLASQMFNTVYWVP